MAAMEWVVMIQIRSFVVEPEVGGGEAHAAGDLCDGSDRGAADAIQFPNRDGCLSR
jgi:hypothetical protein